MIYSTMPYSHHMYCKNVPPSSSNRTRLVVNVKYIIHQSRCGRTKDAFWYKGGTAREKRVL
jgi:hypothetical protein